MNEIISDKLLSVGLSSVMRGLRPVASVFPIPQPTLFIGPGASGRLGLAIAGFGHKKVLIVTDKIISKLGLMNALTAALTEGGTEYVVFDDITQDAPVELIERGIEFFKVQGCDAIVAFGGGSAMDASKTIAVAVANNKRPIQLAGYFKGLRRPITLYAVPTTAGTGSEVTVAAVIANPATKKKLVIVDSRMVPKIAALDPSLMVSIPPHITAATGMDALTHAVEAYVGQWGSAYSDGMALAAVSLIFENLRTVYTDGQNLAAREKMALASTYAGLAFTRANVGYVHAIAHQLGGRYHTPHGLANAIMLPYVLKYSKPNIIGKLADLAVRAKLGNEDESPEKLAQKFLDGVDALNRDIGIPRHLDALREEDIPDLAKAACWEAYTTYPVPRYMVHSVCEGVIREALAKPTKGKKKTA